MFAAGNQAFECALFPSQTYFDILNMTVTDSCGETFVNVSNNVSWNITSPGWPEQYLDDQHCLWSVVAAVGYRVVLTFIEFTLEEDYDFLYVGNENRSDYPFLIITG